MIDQVHVEPVVVPSGTTRPRRARRAGLPLSAALEVVAVLLLFALLVLRLS